MSNLLTAVEVVGYWKVAEEVKVVEFARTKDTPSGAKGTTYTRRVYYYTLLRNEDGTPKKTHDGIVPMDDFLFAFNRESRYTLDGEENTSRYNARATWKPVKKDRQEPLLVGLLTSPNGSTIQYARGTFRVMEKRRKYSSRPSVTLTVNADLVVRLFLCRLQERYIEYGREVYEQAQAELTRVRAHNATALVSVDEQIANYQRSIKNNEDGLAELIATFGRNFNKGTAARLNEDINREQAILNDLIAKRNAATVEESQLQELCDNIVQVIEGRRDCDVTRRFIKLATDKIELAECSAHFATLTVYWSAPFAQVDVCYIWLANGVHENWEDEELARLRELYPHADRLELLQAFPARSWSSLMSVASDRGIKRYTNKNSSDLPTQLALRDQEIIDLLGFHPGNGYGDRDLWVNDVSTGRSVSTRMFSPAQPSIKC